MTDERLAGVVETLKSCAREQMRHDQQSMGPQACGVETQVRFGGGLLGRPFEHLVLVTQWELTEPDWIGGLFDWVEAYRPLQAEVK
jgi:hypothetical protein